MSDATIKLRRVRIEFVPISQATDEDPIVSAENPKPSWIVSASEGAAERIGSWEIWNPHHLTAADYSKIIAADAAWRVNASAEDPMKRLRGLLEHCVPDMPAELFDRLSPNQI